MFICQIRKPFCHFFLLFAIPFEQYLCLKYTTSTHIYRNQAFFGGATWLDLDDLINGRNGTPYNSF